MSTDNIQICLVQPEDHEQIIKFIFEHYFRDEPLCSSEPIIMPGESEYNYIQESLNYNTSIKAVRLTDKQEELVGVNIAVPKGPSSIDKYFEVAEKLGNTKNGQMLKLMGVAGRNGDVFRRYGVDEIFYSFLSCVKPNARGENLGTRLKLELIDLAKTMGYKLMTVNCTGFYSAGVCERLGMERVGFIAYKDYVDDNNKPIFNPPAPHEGLASFAMRL